MTATVTQLKCDTDPAAPGEPLWGAVETQLWFDAETTFTATWSPDGTHVIAKARTERGDVALYITTTAQGNLADAIETAFRKAKF